MYTNTALLLLSNLEELVVVGMLCLDLCLLLFDRKSSYMGEEVLVYGPINREPDEKIGIKKESGIRKL